MRRDEYGRPVAGPSGEWQVEDEELVCRRYEGYLVEGGRLEVQGAPPDGRPRWGAVEAQEEDELHGGLRELGSYRCGTAAMSTRRNDTVVFGHGFVGGLQCVAACVGRCGWCTVPESAAGCLHFALTMPLTMC